MSLEENKPNVYPLWKVVMLCFIPISALYQLSWSWLFSSLSSGFWEAELSISVLSTKYLSEILLYSLMIWFVWARTRSKSHILRLGVRVALSLAIVMTLHALSMLF